MCAAARIASILLSSQITTDTFLAFLTQLLFAVTRSALESALSTAFANKKSTGIVSPGIGAIELPALIWRAMQQRALAESTRTRQLHIQLSAFNSGGLGDVSS